LFEHISKLAISPNNEGHLHSTVFASRIFRGLIPVPIFQWSRSKVFKDVSRVFTRTISFRQAPYLGKTHTLTEDDFNVHSDPQVTTLSGSRSCVKVLSQPLYSFRSAIGRCLELCQNFPILPKQTAIRSWVIIIRPLTPFLRRILAAQKYF
jgi:hypothetical protein